MRRFIVHDRQGNPLFDLDDRITSAVRTEKLNGEHKLDITTTQPLEEGMRILVKDGTLKWREWVIDEPDESHTDSGMEGKYGCTWSMQYDLATMGGGELWPGTYSPIAASAALSMVLATQSTWEVGFVSVGGLAGTSLFDGHVWDYLGELQEIWGGEMEPRIEVDSNGVTHRYVDWLAHVGNVEPTRRFDFGADCTSIRRKVAPGPRYCRIVPRGGRDAQDADGIRYSERCGVEEEPYRADSTGEFVHPANAVYIRDTVAEQLFRVRDRNGNWRYPEKVVCYDLDLDGDQEELLNKAMEDVENHTRPKVTYEADVLQFAAAGMDAHGVQLGDEVHIVDRAFGDVPLRMQGRVVKMTVNELDDTDVQLVIGEALQNMDDVFKSILSAIDSADGRTRAIQAGGTIVYLKTLIDQLNSEINATGGYVYVTDGDGLLTYDKRVTDPTRGTEATKVVEIKGGSIRIADSRTGSGDWNWKTVFVSGHVAAELITVVHITAGYIGNYNSGSYWDLDSGILYSSAGVPLSTALSDAAKVATNYLSFNTSTGLDVGYSGTSAKTRINGSGMELFDGSGASALFAGLSGSNSIVRVGRQTGSGNVVMSSVGYVDIRNASTIMAHFGYGEGTNASGGTSVAPYYTLGGRKAGSTIGNYSTVIGMVCTASGYGAYAEGYNCTASGFASHAEGEETTASGHSSHAEGKETAASGTCSHAEGINTVASTDHSHAEGFYSKAQGNYSHAEGYYATASGTCSHAEGYNTTASGNYSHASGYKTIAYGDYQTVIGHNNIASDRYDFIIGKKYFNSDERANNLTVDHSGDLWIAGTLTQNSDRRLKEHHAYLGEDACDFIRALKPALYAKDGKRHVGFYAQDVQEAEPDGWDTETVTAQHTDESLGFDPLTLDYNALIAPLVAYAQQLERRINQQQSQIDQLTGRLSALEGRIP